MRIGGGPRHRKRIAIAAGIAVVAGGSIAPAAFGATSDHQHTVVMTSYTRTTTPIKHVVVIYDENNSFDHYFGTYPNATNTDGTPFHAAKGTPKVNGLTPALLHHNPNLYNPQRLSPSEALTCDQNHGYTAEQQAFDNGKMDKFVQYTENDTCSGQPIAYGTPGLVMDYFDGNTVTALWNYAQHYSMSDNSFDTVFGPSTPGALDVTAGTTYGATAVDPMTGKEVSSSVIGSPNSKGMGTLYTDADPAYDDCSDSNHTNDDPVIQMQGRNVGNLLDDKNVTWGWFQGGFAPTGTAKGYAQCDSAHENVGGVSVTDYVPHHDPFQFFKSTSNPHHLPPSSEAAIGHTDQANHNYDISDFFETLKDGNMPAVSFLKPPAYENGHAGNSDPLDEQRWLASTIDAIQQSPDWKSTAIIINYDDSDGWYDHQVSPIINGSQDATLDKDPACASKPAVAGQQDRCGLGPRLPMLVISPYSKVNFVDHTVTDQASVIRFIENNWSLGRIGNGSADATAGSLLNMFDFEQRPRTAPLLLSPATGAVETAANHR
jgi:phospholipase C